MSSFIIALISCVVTIIIQTLINFFTGYKANNIFIDFIYFAVIYVLIFTIFEKIFKK